MHTIKRAGEGGTIQAVCQPAGMPGYLCDAVGLRHAAPNSDDPAASLTGHPSRLP